MSTTSVARLTLRPFRVLTALAALVLALVAAVLAGAPATSAPSAAAAGGPRPTVVLVHGAFSGPSAWDAVAASLAKDGYATTAVRLPLTGVADDVAAVTTALDAIPGPKVVVGHSYGGFVVSNAATGRTDVQALVYTAAFVPEAGETIVGLGDGYAPAAFLAPGHLVVDATGRAVIATAFFRDDFAQDLNPKLAATLDAAQQPTSLGILFTPSGPAAWRSIPSWYAVSGADRVIDPALQRFMAARAGATTVTFDDASHAGGFTHYAARFVKLVEQAAQSS
ncbi:alpha/beta fold hydrolase [Intrasporangium flavum]|uniref:alpha/beta fold hydrolase n=1 Tax=Intrasporangium flavum TaxID=1428657 RepID=UPI00096DEC2C|nr:alpha/beta hydrolase [Intrasporangium flavum]